MTRCRCGPSTSLYLSIHLQRITRAFLAVMVSATQGRPKVPALVRSQLGHHSHQRALSCLHNASSTRTACLLKRLVKETLTWRMMMRSLLRHRRYAMGGGLEALTALSGLRALRGGYCHDPNPAFTHSHTLLLPAAWQPWHRVYLCTALCISYIVHATFRSYHA